MNSDKYKTIKEKAIGEGYYSEKRSKFLAFAHHVDSVDEALELVKEYRKKPKPEVAKDMCHGIEQYG